MRIDIVSLFPEMFSGPLGCSIIKRAWEANILEFNFVNPRDFALDKHKIVDDYPFGGGAGMVMKPEPIFAAVESITAAVPRLNRRVILMCPQGTLFSQKKARELTKYDQLVFICGHYEGIDDRVRQSVVDETISIGDYVLTGGELPAMVVIDSLARLLPGVLGSIDSTHEESFENGLLEYPQYTRPRNHNGLEVPEVLLSGDHAKIDMWRRQQSLRITYENRPDLLSKIILSERDLKLLEKELSSGG